jgi:hypothetical protein
MTAQPALLSDLGGAPPCLHAPIVRRPNSFYRRRDRYPIDWLRLDIYLDGVERRCYASGRYVAP